MGHPPCALRDGFDGDFDFLVAGGTGDVDGAEDEGLAGRRLRGDLENTLMDSDEGMRHASRDSRVSKSRPGPAGFFPDQLAEQAG
jgi:hypothetical protein